MPATSPVTPDSMAPQWMAFEHYWLPQYRLAAFHS
jgi:hypothetical protein